MVLLSPDLRATLRRPSVAASRQSLIPLSLSTVDVGIYYIRTSE